jgi:predicted ATP-dependent endonuclease of OLD family
MLHLSSVSISWFRGIREGKLEGLTDVNLLVGRNNCGKTTILEAITRIAIAGGFNADVLSRDINAVWEHNRPAHRQPQTMWYQQEQANNIVLRGTLREGTKPEKAEEFEYRLSTKGQNFSGSIGSEALRTIDPNFKQEFFRSVTVLRPFDAFNQAIEQSFWPKLLSNRRDRLLTKTLNDIFELNAESFQLLPSSLLMVLFENHSLPLDLQGDGTRAAMRIMMVLAMMRKTLLLLEEPECHQHPGSLERFAKALCKFAHDEEVQLVVSTHSAECVRSFLNAADQAKSEGAVFHLALEAGTQTARRLDRETVQTLQATGVDIRFLDLYA